jgi:hypothetical protein
MNVARLLPFALFLLACGDDPAASTTAAAGGTATSSTGTGSSSCSAGPMTLDGLNVEFRRSDTEAEVYRFGAGTFTRDIAPGEASENTGTWTWKAEPECLLELSHAAVPPDWPETFTTRYVLAWESATAGTFAVTRTFADGFTFNDVGTVTVLP